MAVGNVCTHAILLSIAIARPLYFPTIVSLINLLIFGVLMKLFEYTEFI